MGNDPQSADNRWLRESMEDGTPLIYFHAVAPSIYQAIWPAFITAWHAKELSVNVVPGERVFMEARSPTSNVLDRWLGYVLDFILAGYLIRLYARLYTRLRQPSSLDVDRAV